MTAGAPASTRKAGLGPMPEVWGPFPTARACFAPGIRCSIMVARLPPPSLRIRAAPNAETQALWNSPLLHAHPAIRRLSARLCDHVFVVVIAAITHFALGSPDRTTACPNGTRPMLLSTVIDIARHIDARLLTTLARHEAADAEALLLAWLGSAGRLADIWRRCATPACDRELPERRAIRAGPEAMRAFVAAGGSFSAEPDSLGQTDAHVAAIATFEHPDALATFLALGGPFHDHRDRLGRTPSWHVVGCGRVEAVTAFLAVGGRLTDCVDDCGSDLLAAAETWGETMIAVVRDALAGPVS